MEINYDELIKQGLQELFEREFSSVPPEDEIEVEFSETYLKQKQKMIENFFDL